MDTSKERGLRLLSLDGGGIRVLSALYIMQSILLYVQDKLKLPKVPLPCEIFDLIGGTGTGGLVALMFGRLRMSVEDTIVAYVELSKDVFSKKQFFRDGKYSAEALEAAVQKIVDLHAGDTGPGIIDTDTEDKICRTFVCAVTAMNMNARSTSLFRSYRAPGRHPIDCTIVEATRATTAAPTFFERAVITVQGIEREYMDGGVAQNNPCKVVFEEAELVFPGRSIACIISIGTGKLPTISLERPGFIGNMIPLKVAEAMAAIATETESTHETIQRRFRARPNVYFRFNVAEGMQDITLDEWNKLDAVVSHAERYMESEDVRPKLEDSVRVLAEGEPALNVSDTTGNVPAKRNPARKAERKHCPPPSLVFSGRADILAVMNEYFAETTNEQLTFVLHGLGGSGKSEIMRRFVADSQAQVEGHPQRFSEVLYVDASSLVTLEADLSNIAMDKALGDNWRDIVRWLVCTRERWLLVLDNTDDPDMELRPFIPQCSHGNIIITTRNEQLEFYKSRKISRMSKEDAKTLFVRRSLRNPENDQTDRLIDELIEELDYLALGIVQAAAYLQVNKTCTLERYLDMFRSDRLNILEKSRNINNRPDDYKETVYTTWNISLEQLAETHPEAVKFLYICSFLHHKNIPETMFIKAAIGAPGYKHSATTLSHSNVSWIQLFLHPFIDPTPETSEAFHETIGHLCAYSLVEVTLEQNLSIHRLVHDWSRRRARAVQLDPNYSALILCLSFAQFVDLRTQDALAYTRMLLPHMQELQASLGKSLNAGIAFNFGRVYLGHGWWGHAEGAGILAMETMRRVLGDEHPDTLTSIEYLAATYWNQGRWKEAEELQVKVLEASKRVLGEEHPDTLASMANLAATYCNQGRWKEAEELQVKVLEARKRVLVDEHPDTLTSIANLAATYWNQGRWKEAEGLQLKVLEASKLVLGEEHPDTLKSMANLATTYQNQGRWKEAEGLEVKVLEASKRVLGDEHPDTLKSMANLAAIYRNQGRWKEAEGLEVKVLEARKRVLGDEHPDTLKSMANLAAIYRNQGRWKEAEGLEVKAMEAMKRVLGDEHTETLTSMENLALTYWNQGRWNEAEGLQVKVSEARKRVLGDEHPDTLMSMANLAVTYGNQGRWKEAEGLHVKVSEAMKRVLGEDHPATLKSMKNLAVTYMNQGRWKEAEGLQVKVLEARKRVIGDEHPETLTSMINLALIYRKQGRWTEAEGLQMKAMEAMKRVLGDEHTETLTSMENLALTYWNQGRWNEAEGLQVKVSEARKRVLGDEHPDTLMSMANLALTYWNQGRWNEAEGLQVKVSEARKRVLGDEHPDTLMSMANLAVTYGNRWKEAEGLHVKVSEAMKRVLGEDHPATLKSMKNLAVTYMNQGRWKEAEGLLVKVLEARKRVLGEEHPHTLTSMENLAVTYMNQGRWKEAEGLHVKVLEAMKRVLGEDHPATLKSMKNLAFIYEEQGRLTEAGELGVKVLGKRKRMPGEENPDARLKIENPKRLDEFVAERAGMAEDVENGLRN